MNHVASFVESASLSQSASMRPGEHPVVKANAMATHMRASLLFMFSFLCSVRNSSSRAPSWMGIFHAWIRMLLASSSSRLACWMLRASSYRCCSSSRTAVASSLASSMMEPTVGIEGGGLYGCVVPSVWDFSLLSVRLNWAFRASPR